MTLNLDARMRVVTISTARLSANRHPNGFETDADGVDDLVVGRVDHRHVAKGSQAVLDLLRGARTPMGTGEVGPVQWGHLCLLGCLGEWKAFRRIDVCGAAPVGFR